jgi:Curli production assembly/transport component CsgG.
MQEVRMCLHIFLHPSLIRFVLFLFLISIVAPAALSQDNKLQNKKLNIAVLEFEARGGVSKEDAASLSDAFQGQIIETGEFIVVDRNRIKSILQEQGFQQSEACSQVECIVEVGKILKVEKMFAGTIGKVGKIYTINIQVIDIATAQINQNKSRRHDGAIEDLLTDIIPELAAEMAKELTGKDVKVSTGTTGGSSSWVWYTLGGVVVLGGGAAVLLSQKKNDNNSQSQTQPLPAAPGFP